MRKLIFVLVIITVAILGFYRLFVMDIYYPQNVNVAPMADLKIPTVLKTIYGIPCDEIHVLNGFNYETNRYRKDKLKDWITISESGPGFNFANIELYNTPDDALNSYLFEKARSKIQSEIKHTEYDRYFITYIEHARYAEGFYLPTVYISGVVFLKQNLVVEFIQSSHYSKDVKNKEKLIRMVATLIHEHVEKQASQPSISGDLSEHIPEDRKKENTSI